MSDDNNSFLWFLAGLGVGAAVGVLYAPRSGSEMRETLRSKADEGREFVSERARKAGIRRPIWWTRDAKSPSSRRSSSSLLMKPGVRHITGHRTDGGVSKSL